MSSSSRDFDGYRPGSRSRDCISRPPAPSRSASGDYTRDRDRDRHHERDPRDRERRNERDRDRNLDMARTTTHTTTQDRPSKVDSGRASAELADALRHVTDLMTQRAQLSLKRDAELKAYQRRKKDYDSQISKPVQFPAVLDAFLGSQNHHRQTLAGLEKDLNALASMETVAFDKYAQTLVKALPFDDVKIRQIVEASKADKATADTPSQPAQDERFKALEQRQAGFEDEWKKQIALLREAQEKQASELAEYKQKDRLRADTAKENGQLRAQVASLRSEVTSLIQRVALAQPAESLRAYVDSQTGSLKAELNKTMEEARRQSSAKPSPSPDGQLRQEMLALGQKCDKLRRDVKDLEDTSTSHTERITSVDTGLQNQAERIAGLETRVYRHDGQIAGLDTRVQKHDGQIADLDTAVRKHEGLLSGIDVEGLDDWIADYTPLKGQAAAQDMAIADLKQSLDQLVARIPERIPKNIPGDLPASFKEWSDRFLLVFGTRLDEHTKQIRGLQDSKSNMGTAVAAQISRAETTSTPGINTSLAPELESRASRVVSAVSRLTEIESKTAAIDSAITASKETVDGLQKTVAAWQGSIDALEIKMDRRYRALETMVESLSSQWNNVSTAQVAQAILEQLGRLQPAQLAPEIRHLHERLSEVEKFAQEDSERHKNMCMGLQSVCDDMAKAPKRGLGSEEKFPGHHDKRARIEGQNGVNGYGNGYVHQ